MRLELLSVEQLKQHAKALAGWHEVDERKGRDRLLPRLAENEAVLLNAYGLVSAAAKKGLHIAPAAEWLLDNFYLIEEQVRTARRHLPKGYSRELPRLVNGTRAGFPRVYDLALELISHLDGRIDAESLSSFVASYQTIATLKIGELWAVPIMLRLALVENLRRVAARVAAGRQARDLANVWAERMLEVAEKEPGNLVLVLADMVRDRPLLSSAFVAEFARRLQGQHPALALPVSWLEQRLAEQGQTIENLVAQEGQAQAADQVSIGNSIGSLRFLSAMDWREFVETMSAVEYALRGDPADVYSDMDFATRDEYRHVVEKIARRSPLSEEEVARAAIELARAQLGRNGEDERTAHVGYYLLDKGRRRLERTVRMRTTPGLLLRRFTRRQPMLLYGGSILAVTVIVTAVVLWGAAAQGLGAGALAWLAIPLAIAASQLGVSLANWLATLTVRPVTLPRLDFAERIPPDCKTVVVVPTMLTGSEGVVDLLEGLEVRFLANRDPNLSFALLTDFRDAPQEHMPGDDELLRVAQEGIEALNIRYASGRTDLFFLFHRPRRWNEQEGVWMGWERKRGKLSEFNAFLRGGAVDRFNPVVGRASALRGVKFVITLDTDTQLPRDAAKMLVGTMAHPLNRPRFDERRGRVVDGYCILQPRVGVSLLSAGRSWFARLFAGDAGIDPYTRAVSDVYQDVFAEGSFIGKGIYDVDAFEKTCGQRFPENRILSHDLLEGAHARAGLISDVLLFEEFPSRYMADVSRQHRWIRGDWQIMPWILPRVPGADERRVSNCISTLSKWKIFDNLRRSLVPVSLALLLVSGWFLPGTALLLTCAAVGVIALPVLLRILAELVQRPEELPFIVHFRESAASAGRQLAQAGFAVVSLPYDAYVSLDAIIRTVVRVWFTRRKLLEWVTASEAEQAAQTDLAGFYRSMWVAPVMAALGAGAVLLWRPEAAPVVLPIGILWALAPAVAWWLSRPIEPARARLSDSDRAFLRYNARRTWRFFETFVGPADSYLPPDNFQEHPVEVVAHRTSPTNIGLSLLSNLGAYDFGYVSAGKLIERTFRTLDSVSKMERFRGHLYNWYDTRTLQPLTPLYISTVDSGNLAGHLLTLAPGLEQMKDQPVLPPRVFAGVSDTLEVLAETARGSSGAGRTRATMLPEPLLRLERMREELEQPPRTLAAAHMLLQRVAMAATELVVHLSSGTDEELRWWAAALERQSRDFLDDMVFLAPWILLPPPTEPMWRRGSKEQVHRLGDLRELLRKLDSVPTLAEAAELKANLLPSIDAILADLRTRQPDAPADEDDWFTRLHQAIADAAQRAKDRMDGIAELAHRCRNLADLNYSFLYDRSRHLLSIGYNVSDHRLDASYYDLLASEARLCSFVAIAQGKLPQEHWFSLGRLLTTTGGEPVLLSWSGSMFEYLMPMLVMPSYENTLLDQSCRAAVQRQIEYGRQRGVPWGISESGYNTTDIHLNYQYRAFGVPGLGLKRGLSDDLVIAPYASAMALMLVPEEACQNLRRLAGENQVGRYGFYEAVDYTPAHVPRGQSSVTVRSYMAHHQGMSFLALAHHLLDRPMQRRFESDPLFKATDLLLHERVPKVMPVFPHAAETAETPRGTAEAELTLRVFKTPDTPLPEVHLLSNGRYHVMISAAGGGASRWRDLALTRWHEDGALDRWGTFCYIREPGSDRIWSAAHQPTGHPAKTYEAIFSQARAEFRRRDGDFDTHTEIGVSPEDDVEVRRITVTNRGRSRKSLQFTSFAEVVLAHPAADAAHPAFGNLFVQTQIVRGRHAILCTRRPRSASERPPWMLHLMAVQGQVTREASFETDRSEFIGRGRRITDPAAVHVEDLSDSEGAVLDPAVAVRQTVSVGPEEAVAVVIVTGVAETRDAATALIEKYHDVRLAERVFELAWTHSQVVLRQLDSTEAEAQLYGRLASSILYLNPQRRAPAGMIARNRRGQWGLWGYGISGDFPIVLLRIADITRLGIVRQLVRAHAYWRVKGFPVDLVIWNEDVSGYRQELQDQIMGIIAASPELHMVDQPGGIFVRRVEQIPEEDRVLMQAVARVILSDAAGTLAEQVDRRMRSEIAPPAFAAVRSKRPELPPTPVDTARRDLAYYNGLGGFTQDGREYIITTRPDRVTPAPWSNVIANPKFGTVVTESGGGYTWAENAHEYRLTPWYNDPVCDTSGEAYYIRDEETGRFWSPTPLPARGRMPYLSRHGFGYSVFEYTEGGISSEMWTYVAIDAPVKFVVMRIRNSSGAQRRLSVTGFVEWVLGEHRWRNMAHVVTETDAATGGILARNAYSSEFGSRVAFFNVSEPQRTLTGNRSEFLGRNGSYASPAAMRLSKLSGRLGAGLDPCAAMQVIFDLADGQEREVAFILGAGQDRREAEVLLKRFRRVQDAREALEVVWQSWNQTLGAVYVETPDTSVNFLVNGWLLYQVLSCRMWGRSGFYQSGGAFGFRDQLQDAMALLHTEPSLLRSQLIRSAGRQFREGDVQHWWHPPVGRGVRTRISDDYLWLPLATCRYVRAVGDTGVLEEQIGFLEGRPLKEGEEGYYDLPSKSEEIASLYVHCVRAIRNGLKFGEHGLPLMGAGDWNDGMNLVGEHGKGESVWLAFFLYTVLTEFSVVARQFGDAGFAQECDEQAAKLRANIEQQAWDGQWYRRAYFDSGEPLGSASSPECQIDSLPQSWSVLSKAGDPKRSRTAMEAVDARLVRRQAKLIQLFDPPFDNSHLNPGYIKGYVPGVRENGAQYTHAAIWSVMAFAAIGDAERAWELLSLINPVQHGASQEAIRTYKVEPYVVAADVYTNPQHLGRGGWTWYTGSAGWMYRLITESLLGVRLEVDRLRLEPLLPAQWTSLKIHYRYRETFYHIEIRHAGRTVQRVTVDGVEQPGKDILMTNDRQEHEVVVEMA
ncbi:MAG: hypothetical protein AMXMBFR13_13110 [Phycisphaerae bacterium]